MMLTRAAVSESFVDGARPPSSALSESVADDAGPPICAVSFSNGASAPTCGVRKLRRRYQPARLRCQEVSPTVPARPLAVSESFVDGASPPVYPVRKFR